MLFISPLKLFSVSGYLNFCLDFLLMYKDNLIRKMSLISKCRRHNLAIKLLQHTYYPNILRSKSNQTINFDRLIEYNMRNIFLEKTYTKCG